MLEDNEKSSRKRHRMSRSEGKDSSISKRNSKADKKSRNVSQNRLDNNGSSQKDSFCANPVLAATSSSSKVSGSFRVNSKFQEVKGSPVESVSSSPLRNIKSDKLTSGSKVILMNDNVHDTVKMTTSSPRRRLAGDYEGSGDQSGALKKDIISNSILHGSQNHSMIDMQDKLKEGLQLNNGNGYMGNLDLDNGYPLQAQASLRSVNDATKAEAHLDTYRSSSVKSCKGSPSLSKEKHQALKSNSAKGKVKMSGNGNSLDQTEERDRKIKFDETCGSNADKSEKCTIFHSKEASLLKSEERDEVNGSRSSKNFEVGKTEDLLPLSVKEKPRHLPRSDGEKSEGINVRQSCQENKASTSACDARADGLPRLNKKADVQSGTPIPSKHPVSNGSRIKNQEAPSPLRRDPSSQAASSAIKEATNLKHLADRLKSSGSAESTGMYFEAALKFLHGASLLESGKPENIKHADFIQSIQIYSSTAKLCQFCAHEFEKLKDMATAALAYKCVEVAYMRVIYSSHNAASRDRNELQTALQMVPPGESPSSSASDIDNLNNTANGDKAAQPRSGSSPQLTANLVIAARNRPNFSRLLSFVS
ncbi:AF4/FMR2 family member 3 [Bienertia sinuspersici]